MYHYIIFYLHFEQIPLLTIINGENCDKKGEKILKSVADAIIDKKIRNLFSWTGKSNDPLKPKIAFCIYKEIVKLIHTTIRITDPNYSQKECEKNLTYKFFKPASCKKP